MELLLDHFQVEACYLQEQAVLAMYSYSAISGIVGELSCTFTSSGSRGPSSPVFCNKRSPKGLKLFSGSHIFK